MAAHGRRKGWYVAALSFAFAGGVVWLVWWAVDSALTPRHAMPWPVAGVGNAAPVAQTLSPVRPGSDPLDATTLSRVVDPIGNEPDLKRVFDEYIASGDPRQRRVAVRAFEACVPAFLPGAGQAPSPEALIQVLPADHQIEREGAYRTLFARCHRLVAVGRVSLDSTLQTLERDPQNQAPGQRAQEAALVGKLDRVEMMVSEALSGSDPAAVASLAGLAARIVPLRQTDPADGATLQRAREVDVALSLAACDVGLDCSAQSLWALQMCATQGLCEGDVTSRLMARVTPGSVDPGAVQQQRLRLLGLIQSGRTLGLDDLLPP
jgi:hypothetical protein